VSPGHKKALAQAAVAAGVCSGRKACRALGLARATWWYRAGPVRERRQQLTARLHALAAAHPRYGHRRMAALLRQEGWAVGKRQVQRLRRQAGLRVPPTKRKRVRRGRATGWPARATHRNHVWTWDFIADATVRGGALRMLTVLDEHTRECHVLRADRALKSADVIALVKQAIAQHGVPEFIRSDNGSEFIAKALQRWLAAERIKTIYIEPASPWQNGFVESFHGRFRDECLNREQFWTLTEARVVIEDFRLDYNTRRPHSSLHYRSPAEYAAQLSAAPTPVGLRPPSVGAASTQATNPTLTHPSG
jgi:transposase InsO family protein